MDKELRRPVLCMRLISIGPPHIAACSAVMHPTPELEAPGSKPREQDRTGVLGREGVSDPAHRKGPCEGYGVQSRWRPEIARTTARLPPPPPPPPTGVIVVVAGGGGVMGCFADGQAQNKIGYHNKFFSLLIPMPA